MYCNLYLKPWTKRKRKTKIKTKSILKKESRDVSTRKQRLQPVESVKVNANEAARFTGILKLQKSHLP